MSEWRPIPGWEGIYEASTDGQIRGCARKLGRSSARERILSQHADAHQGARVNVVLGKPGRRFKTGVGRLVLLAFVGPPPEGMECCHNDGNPWNNSLSNLRWDTHSANGFDSVAHGNHWSVSAPHSHRSRKPQHKKHQK